MSEFIFEARNVNKQFVNHRALTDVNISVPKGQIFGLLGPNGAGKTTLIRIINQITAPDSGELWFKGKKLTANDVAHIGYLPEERGLYKKMKIGEQALYMAQLKGMSKRNAMEKLKYWFRKFEIESWWDKKVEELSKGMQQKVQFIITILHEPELLIFDEPFSGFDPINANLLKQEILYLRDQGASIIFSTHNMSSVEEVCDHIALINKSEKILDGPINEVRHQYKTNTFELTFDGRFDKMAAAMTSKYKIEHVSEENNLTKVRVGLINDLTTNDLLNMVMPMGNIVEFKEIIPSMNDVFIQVVNESSNKMAAETTAAVDA